MNKTLIYAPRKWHSCKDNEWEKDTEVANCYSYVLNNPNYYWSVPGLGFAHTAGRKYADSYNFYFAKMSVQEFRDDLIKGAKEDGLIAINSPQDREGYYLGALFFPKDEKDFHWYRQDDNGLWSHKDGWYPALNQNKEGNYITDPVKDAKPLYPIFGGYFLIPRNGVILNQNFPLLQP